MTITEKTKEMIIDLAKMRNNFNEFKDIVMLGYHHKLNSIKEELDSLGFFIEIDKLVLEIPISKVSNFLYCRIIINKNDNITLNGYTIQDYFIKVQEKAENYLKEQDFDSYKFQVDIIDILSHVNLSITTERALNQIIEKLNKRNLIGFKNNS